MVLSHSLSLFTPTYHLLPQNLIFFRNQGRVMVQQRNCEQSSSNSTSEPILHNAFSTRDFLLFGLSASLLSVFPSSRSFADEDVKMDLMVDEINAYSYLYPLELPLKKFLFKWVESRKPERYSADARLRIMSERVDFIDNLIISITIGPPNSRIIKSPEKSTWTAKEVADSVLSDKSALIDGEPYWYYEYLVRKSPTKLAQDSNIFRHYVAATAERDGYFYTLNASTLNKQWNKMGPLLEKTAASFRLLAPTEEYVPPYKDPWRFW